MGLQSIGWSSAAAALSIAALWGGNVVAIKVGLTTFPPFWSALWRMLVGAAVVGLWARTRGISLAPLREEIPLLGMLGLLFTVQIALLNLGVEYTSPAYAVVLINSHPVFANLISHFFVVEDRLSWRRILGLAIAFGGVCLVFLGKPEIELAPRPLLGNFVVTLSGFLLGARTVFTQRLVQVIHPARPVFWQMILSLPFFLLAGWLWEKPLLQPVNGAAVWAILYQGAVVAGLCFIVWTTLLTRHSPGSLSMFAFLTPIFGVVASAWFYHEPLSADLWVGVAAVTAGILMVTRQRSGPAVVPSSSVYRSPAP